MTGALCKLTGLFSRVFQTNCVALLPPASPLQLTLKRWPPPCLLRGCSPSRLLWSDQPLRPQRPQYQSPWTPKVAWWRSRKKTSTVSPSSHAYTHTFNSIQITTLLLKSTSRKVRRQLITLTKVGLFTQQSLPSVSDNEPAPAESAV